MSSWLISASVEDWNYFLENRKLGDRIKAKKLAVGDTVCFYVRGTSSIKGVATIDHGDSLQFQKVGDVNYFGIASSLGFVKDEENVVKYLKNFDGVANLGKPIPEKDMSLISSQITIQEIPEASVSEASLLKPPVESRAGMETRLAMNDQVVSNRPDYRFNSYKVMFDLENALRHFIVKALMSISTDWLKERVPDQNIVKEWERRRDQDKKQRRWYEEQELGLIYYSDFYDLVTLIVNRGNWSKCFEKIFGKQSIIESKMYELVPIRNKLAHNRPLIDEEVMALRLYSTQILRLIESGPPNPHDKK